MREKFLISFFSIVITLGCLVGGSFVLAWAEPQMAPPDGNVPAPINVSADGQSKSGGLGLGGIASQEDVGLMVTGDQFAVHAFNPVVQDPDIAIARALLATPSSAAEFFYSGNTPAVNITAEKVGLNIVSAKDYGVTTHGKAGGIFAANSSNTNLGSLGMDLGYGIFAQGVKYGGYLSSNDTGLLVENADSDYYVEAATQDYALKAVKDGNTYAILGDASGYGLIVEGGIKAAAFEGGVDVNGNLFVSGSCSDEGEGCFGDLAENIDTALDVEVGDIVEINEQGFVEKAKQAYSKKAIGVISDPAIVFPGAQINPNLKNVKRQPLALTGLVSVKVSNINGPIEIGDYITSSSIPGYGMKAITSGPVIGKALQAFDKNRGSMIILLDLDWVGSDR